MKRHFLWWSAVVVAVTLAATSYVHAGLPARVPAHWNAAGQVDGYGPPGWVFIQPAIMMVVAALWLALPALSPRRFTVDSFASTWWFSGAVVLALLAWIQGALLWTLTQGGRHLPHLLTGGTCLMIVLLGNVLGKVRRNFWLGIRTPWTLADERVWYATHRLGAKTMVAGGLLGFGVVLAGWPTQLATGVLVLGALVPAGYSLVYSRRLDKAGGTHA